MPIKGVSLHARFRICTLVEWGLPAKGWNKDGFATRLFLEMFRQLEWSWVYGNQKLNQGSSFQAIVIKKQREAGNAKQKQLIYFQYLTDPWLGLLGAAATLVLMTETGGRSTRNKQKLQTIAQTHFQVLRALKCKITGTWNCPFNFSIQLLCFH